MKTRFHDRHEQRDYAKVVALARALRADPGLAVSARAFVRDHMAGDPHQAGYAAMWLDLLGKPVELVADRLLADTPEGALLRQTRPPFGPGMRSCEVARLIEAMDAEEREH